MRASLAVLMVLLAHQGEEFVIALPAVMLGAAFFLMRWAHQGESEDKTDEGPPPLSEATVETTPEAAGWGHG